MADFKGKIDPLAVADFRGRLEGLRAFGSRYKAIAEARNVITAADARDANPQIRAWQKIVAREFLQHLAWEDKAQSINRQARLVVVVGVLFLVVPDAIEVGIAALLAGLIVWALYDIHYRKRPTETPVEELEWSEEDLRQGKVALQQDAVPLYELAERLSQEFRESGKAPPSAIAEQRKNQWLMDLHRLQQLAVDVWVGVEPAQRGTEEFEIWQEGETTLDKACRHIEKVRRQAKDFVDDLSAG